MKQKVDDLLARLTNGAPASEVYHPDAIWHGPHPFNDLRGPQAIGAVWAQLRAALPDLERRPQILVGGTNQPDARISTPRRATLVASMGHYMGQFNSALLGIPATHGAAQLRFGEVHCLEGDKIIESWVLWDFPDLMHQAGVWPLPPSFGAQGLWPAPATCDGLRATAGQTDTVALDRVLAMHAALLSFDSKDLSSMPHAEYWTPDFMWYGPCGIGATRGLAGFRAHHQIPFLRAFPDRAGTGHFIRISDGPYAVTGGWPSVTATHHGTFLGMTPTGRPINMRVMDFYRFDGNRIAENWVPIDIVHIALQMGNDIFARLRHMRGDPDLTL